MNINEFERAFQFGVDTGGSGITSPELLGCDTTDEALEQLADTASDPLRRETFVYRLRGSESRLVGINAVSKDEADEILQRKKSAAVAVEEYVGELNELLLEEHGDE